MKGKKILKGIVDEASELLYGGKGWREYKYLESFCREYEYDSFKNGYIFSRYVNSIGQIATSAGIGFGAFSYFSGGDLGFWAGMSGIGKAVIYVLNKLSMRDDKKFRGDILRLYKENEELMMDEEGEEWKRNTDYERSDEL